MAIYTRKRTLQLIKNSKDVKTTIQDSIALYNGFEKRRLWQEYERILINRITNVKRYFK